MTIYYREPTYAATRGVDARTHRGTFRVRAVSRDDAVAQARTLFQQRARDSGVGWVREVVRVECRRITETCFTKRIGRAVGRLKQARVHATQDEWGDVYEMLSRAVDEVDRLLDALEMSDDELREPEISTHEERRGQSDMRDRIVEALRDAGYEEAADVAHEVQVLALTIRG